MEENEVNLHHTYEDVRDIFITYIHNEDDKTLIYDAYSFAKEMHKDQKRKSGEPYLQHLIETAYTLASLQAGPHTIAAGFLHDVVEDCNVTLDEIETRFGKDIRTLVDAVTKIQQMKLNRIDEEEFEAEGHRKIFIAMAKDIRVIIIKLADRLHNMRTLSWLKPERQIAISRETLEVYAPIAHRLGINKIKSELEDLSLKYLEPEKYEEIVTLLNQRVKNRQESLGKLKKKIADALYEAKIPFEIESRVKSIYSIYKKIYVKGRNFDEIYDIMALRIITETEINCYEALGLIHATYKPIPGRFKDYIAMPKPNMYQSLHTSIIAGDGQIFEVQIRTKEMDEIAESGVAAHWRYKEGTKYSPEKEQQEIEEKLHWFREFVQFSQEGLSDDAKEYMETLNKDIFDANVYVFTPKGKVVDLPNGSTPLDFAYRIHTKVGDAATGAIVNGTLVPLNTTLKTGDVVEIKTSKTSPGPNEGWLQIVRTNQAKNHIRKFLQKKNAEFVREDRIAQGKSSLIVAFRDRGLTEQEMLDLVNQNKVLNYFNVPTIDDLFIAICNRTFTTSAVIDFLNIKRKKKLATITYKEEKNDHCPVYVKNAGKVAITLGSCCTPIPGDDIVGYITKGKGITVHRRNCPNIQHEHQRLIDVYWNEQLTIGTYPVDIAIESSDRPNLLVDFMAVFAQLKVSISSISAKVHPSTMQCTVQATIYVSDAKRLTDIFNVLLNIQGVYDVRRVIH
ncbi:MAG: bifunctional (p)ppGpp synthetase/guanosine-3',5'-bis(diphosphate) 3'-pyrophosphohydrolase [Coprobacillus sp.]|mgnify:FL=1|nr:bifunctional (p)ppGpp synthetase/guanosine-3',5'-bis(diphosphate) 3'-pyrophosphohydrolase [Coprobacillus sp.]